MVLKCNPRLHHSTPFTMGSSRKYSCFAAGTKKHDGVVEKPTIASISANAFDTLLIHYAS